jgi:hypothetical protein
MALKTTLTPAEHANIVQGLTIPVALNALQVGALSASKKSSFIADAPMAIRNLRAKVGTCGTASNTVVEVRKNGVVVATVTVAHDDADGIQKVALPTTDDLAKVVAGDVIDVNVSAIATGAADLDATAHIDRRFE